MVPPPLRFWSLGRRSGRVAAELYPPPSPPLIVARPSDVGNDLAGVRWPGDVPRGLSASSRGLVGGVYPYRLGGTSPQKLRAAIESRPESSLLEPLGSSPRPAPTVGAAAQKDTNDATQAGYQGKKR